jgi:hypothetical protein
MAGVHRAWAAPAGAAWPRPDVLAGVRRSLLVSALGLRTAVMCWIQSLRTRTRGAEHLPPSPRPCRRCDHGTKADAVQVDATFRRPLSTSAVRAPYHSQWSLSRSPREEHLIVRRRTYLKQAICGPWKGSCPERLGDCGLAVPMATNARSNRLIGGVGQLPAGWLPQDSSCARPPLSAAGIRRAPSQPIAETRHASAPAEVAVGKPLSHAIGCQHLPGER